MPDDLTLHRARVFERFWEALVSGRTVASPDELEPDVVEVARRLRALDRPAATDSAATDATFESRLWEDLMQTHAFDASIPLRPAVLPHANGRAPVAHRAPSYPPISPGTARGRRSSGARSLPDRWGVMPRLALAAVVLLSLVTGLIALDPDLRRPDRGDVIPAAIVQDASPSPTGVLDQGTLVEVAMPDGIIVSGERTDVALVLYTVPAGTTSRPAGTDSNGCCPGLDVAFVLDGTATVRGDGSMRRLPSGGSLEPEDVAAGTEVTIGPGDTLLFQEDVVTDWTVADGGSLSLLWGLVLGRPILDPPFGPTGWVMEDVQMKGPVSFPVDPFAVRLWPTTLAPGTTLAPEPGDVQLVVSDPSEDARLSEPGGYAYANRGGEPVDLYVMTLSTTDPGPASPTAAVASPTSAP